MAPPLKLKIEGMHCASCKELITEALEEKGVHVTSFSFDAKKQSGIIEITTDHHAQEVASIIKAQGEYKVAKA